MQHQLSKLERRIFYNSQEWRDLRPIILERDNFECQWCKEDGDVKIKGDITKEGKPVILEIDHIKELKDYPELSLEPSNLRTLCKDCHNKRHKRFNFKESKRQKKWNDEWW
ncbi:HNH endonuclease [Marinilactibacillus psychrotolerans]|uniref:Putative HNH nuclease YajD n=1 Tax=Marinilactibacillus psychrotolerans TaxID=191770 RepID=A0AAV3WV40_9LACT|nr:HNH endonuclease [Marinilactibacillus psychrotolerans]GEL67239.1 HNH endonuclease [Marinilactibacillus psychrotolerans]GEQ36043.1 HNH endonuclease [Marinilactibacillus psychrotolerans]SDC61139.1 HNH endonuclease [Marinilactibacillus psychrotolerans]